jgi:hypothetical protein
VADPINVGNDPTIFNTKLYRQDLWNDPEIINKFNNGASIFKINTTIKPSFYSPFTNKVNGVPQWLFKEKARLPVSLIMRIGDF